MLKRMALFLAGAAVVLGGAHLAFGPPSLEGRAANDAGRTRCLPASAGSPLHHRRSGPGPTGVLPRLDGPDAFAARIALIRAAEVPLDVQYYIWQRDATGLILLDELRRAAGRCWDASPAAAHQRKIDRVAAH